MARGRRREHLGRLPRPAGVPRHLAGAAEPRPLPRRHRPVPPRARRSSSRRARPDRRRVRGVGVADWLLWRNPSRSAARTRSSAWTCRSSRSACRSGASCSASGSRSSCCRWSPRSSPTTSTAASGCRRRARRPRPAARAHISVLLGLFVLLKAVAYWLDRYGLVVKDGARITGGDVHRRQRGAAGQEDPVRHRADLRAAVLRDVVPRTWSRRASGFGLLVLSAVLIGGIYPAFVQQFQVQARASPTRRRRTSSATSTRRARRTGSTTSSSPGVHAATDPKPAAVRRRGRPSSNVRLIDPAVVSPTFHAAAADPRLLRLRRHARRRPLHRYRHDGTAERDAVVAVRELNLDGLSSRAAQLGQRPHRLHPRLRHGRGLRQHQRRRRPPSLLRVQHPAGGAAEDQRSRGSTSARTRRTTRSSARRRARRRSSSTTRRRQRATARRTTRTPATGGVPIGRSFGRLLFAVKFGEQKILLSDRINSDSQDPLQPRPARPGRRRSRRG